MKLTTRLLAATAVLSAMTMATFGAGSALACGGCGAHASATEASSGCAAHDASARMAGAGDCPAGCPMGSCGMQSGMAGCPGAAGGCQFAACCMNSVRYEVTAGAQHVVTFDRDKAFAFAKSTGAPVTFYVMDAAYTTESAAKEALFISLDHRLHEMLSVQRVVNGQPIACGPDAGGRAASGRATLAYRVPTHDFARPAEAAAYLRTLRAKIASVNIVAADGRPVKGCAAAYAKQCGKKNLTFKVGDQVVADAVTADVLRAQQQLAIVLGPQA